ncbi:hypothetical protein FNV43_RR20836 [Rhamnella rubrinervis]|uniref:C2H2-type domain-containing protein n=1 Tax=Rhamnella rubrinervis TaxID=2594499 RepID=A0A8K0DVK1_9ROSA|nr:hypothetical protein FNV43_RR20836 [Rhamnella rubrinervis]
MAYEESEWAKVAEEEEEGDNGLLEGKKKNELYCVVCGMKFKSDKQWKNHEQSKKHRDKVAEFRESIGYDEFQEVQEGDDERRDMDDGLKKSDEDEFYDVDNVNVMELFGVEIGSGNENENEKEEYDDDDDDDELGVLQAMASAQKNRKNETLRLEPNAASTTNARVENDTNEIDYNCWYLVVVFLLVECLTLDCYNSHIKQNFRVLLEFICGCDNVARRRRKREMAGEFVKILTASDVSQRLAIPIEFLGDQYRGGEQLMVVDAQTQNMYKFVLSTRQGPYRKPAFTKEWLKYSRDQQLQVGQKLYFWKNDNEEFYRIQILRDLLGAGLQ